MPLPVYAGPFGPAQAERLLWRAGFGPRPGEERALAGKGLDGAVAQLLTTRPDRLVGRPPKVNGRRLYPLDKFGHDHLWWLDRMVRTSRPLTERAVSFWGVQISDSTRRALLTYAQKTMGAAVADDDRQRKFPPMTLNALRHLVAASPEMQTS